MLPVSPRALELTVARTCHRRNLRQPSRDGFVGADGAEPAAFLELDETSNALSFGDEWHVDDFGRVDGFADRRPT